MPSPESFTGFPWGTVTYETTEDVVYSKIAEAARVLTSQPNLLHPPTIAEQYALYTRFPVHQPDGTRVELTAIVPMDKASYDELWHFVPPPKAEVVHTERPATSALDIFAPKQPSPEPDDDDPHDSFFETKRLYHNQRMEVIRRVAGRIATDPEIDRYINSFGTFSNVRGAPTHNQNLGATDIGYIVYTGERPTRETLLYKPANAGHSTNDVRIYNHGHVSPFTGEGASSESDRTKWEELIRADTQRLAASIASVADFYDSIYGEYGLDYKAERNGTGSGTLLGTIATRDFFEGYISLAPVGITLLAANQSRALNDEEYGYGQPFINSPDYWVDNIYPSEQLYFAVRPTIETRPTLVEFSNRYDVTSPETWSKMTAYSHTYDVSGLIGKRNIKGGSYGMRIKDLKDGELPSHTPEIVKKQVGEAGLAHIRAGGVFAEETHAFSHTDFYRMFEQIVGYSQ